MKHSNLFIVAIAAVLVILTACNHPNTLKNEPYISFKSSNNQITIFNAHTTPNIIVDRNDYSGLIKVVNHLASDIEKVTGTKPKVLFQVPESDNTNIIIGTLNKSNIIDSVSKAININTKEIRGKWETFIIQSGNNNNNIIIAGSDKRGAIYGAFDFSESIGVSPWHWWADVPVAKSKAIFFKKGIYSKGTPKVKYRGIFINDEAPCLTNWANEKFGGFNHNFYEKVFELLLRNKANYLWPAMWGKAFYDDDSLNAVLANEYGIVIGFSHHEPMMRSHAEWSKYGNGPWNYTKNKHTLDSFWTKGIKRMGSNENMVTIGMRGDGDEPMTKGTAIDLMEDIIYNQRTIIKRVTGKPIEETPQTWALYKEVQDYYNQGMQVPDDVSLLLCDDNWGNLRFIPAPDEPKHPGGYGIYYHFDYVGGPVSYKFMNVTQIERVWEQMNLAYQHGVNKIWLVNVGDLKPMELPISFFLDFAWNPENISAIDLPAYYKNWASRQFGKTFAEQIAQILAKTTKLNAQRTPEMITSNTFSITNYNEANRIIEQYNQFLKESNSIIKKLDTNYYSAYYQLVHFPIEIAANMRKMYTAVAYNHLYGNAQLPIANSYAQQANKYFIQDSLLVEKYHNLNNKKWDHLMSQTHIGYTSWNEPPQNIMPEVIKVKTSKNNEFCMQIENCSTLFPINSEEPKLPIFDPINNQSSLIQLFNKGNTPIKLKISSENDWITILDSTLVLKQKLAFKINIDWGKAPTGFNLGYLHIFSAHQKIIIKIQANNTQIKPAGHIENSNLVSIEASSYSKALNKNNISWLTVPNLGKTGSGVIIYPTNIKRQELSEDSPCLEYTFTVFNAGEIEINTFVSPTLNFRQTEGLLYGISIDNEQPTIVNIHKGDSIADWKYPYWWNTSVTNRIKIKKTKHQINNSGIHTLRVWLIDSGIVFQKFIINAGGLKPSYLGAPESNSISIQNN